jgi:hypothetical protein
VRGARFGAAAIAAQALRPVAWRDDLTHGRANTGAQAPAAEQQVRKVSQESSIDVRRWLHSMLAVTVTARE